MALFVLGIAIVLSIYTEVHGLPIADSKNDVLYQQELKLRHEHMICAHSIEEITRDITYNKRDDVLINLTLNVCFPGVSEQTLLLLLSRLNLIQQSVETNPPSSGNEMLDDTTKWDDGLLPEEGPGQEGVEAVEAGGDGGGDNSPNENLPPGQLPETGPGQEGIENGGKDAADENTDNHGLDVDAVEEDPNQPIQSHTSVCAQAVDHVTRDVSHDKRDDVLINLVINVCFPGRYEEILQLLLSRLNLIQQPVTVNPTSSDNEMPNIITAWDDGLLPEEGPGQEGLDGIGGGGGHGDSPAENLPTGYLPETGPGQEGVGDNGGNVGDEDTNDEDLNDDNWWKRVLEEIINKDTEQS